MAAVNIITQFFETDSFASYEQSVYDKYQEAAEREIVKSLNELLSNFFYLQLLKEWGAKSACRFQGFQTISIRLKSGQEWKIESPVFYKAKSKRKQNRSKERQKGAIRHLGLELLGIIKQVSPALIEVCVSMAVLCPSFEVAANALKGLGVKMNQHFLQNLVQRFGNLAIAVRFECHDDAIWHRQGLKILVCVDGGRIRNRQKKRGRRKNGQKRQGYKSDWIEPRQLTITQFDENGQKINSISPILDGSCGSMDDFFDLLKQHLLKLNLDGAQEIVFCADGGKGIWPRIDNLINDLELIYAKRVLDYTHAKQNINTITQLISGALKLVKEETVKLSKQIKDLLWRGNISDIAQLVKDKLAKKRKASKAALKKLNEYFSDHSKFQYKTFRDEGLPTGSGTVESAIRRVINLRIKGTGMFWKRENAEKIILLRSLVLTGKLKMACSRALGIPKTMFNNNVLDDLPMAA